MRGIGGIFFDDLGEEGNQDQVFALARTCGEAFLPAYKPIIEKRLGMPFGEQEKRWQGIRRVSILSCMTDMSNECTRANMQSST